MLPSSLVLWGRARYDTHGYAPHWLVHPALQDHDLSSLVSPARLAHHLRSNRLMLLPLIPYRSASSCLGVPA